MTPPSRPVAIVTAASRGMGAACARRLAQRGYSLVLMARSPEVLSLASELDATGLQGSVTNPADLDRLAAEAESRFGRVDAVVNNTGHPARGELLELADQSWREGLDLLLFNVIRLARRMVPLMKDQGGGALVNISTLGAEEPSLDFPISSVARAGLSAFTKLFADRYGAEGIRMNNVLPGFVDSFPVSDEIRDSIPAGREARVEEIASVVAFLLSDESSYINGQSLRVDGGLGRSL